MGASRDMGSWIGNSSCRVLGVGCSTGGSELGVPVGEGETIPWGGPKSCSTGVAGTGCEPVWDLAAEYWLPLLD